MIKVSCQRYIQHPSPLTKEISVFGKKEFSNSDDS